jgi:acyl carrier protein
MSTLEQEIKQLIIDCLDLEDICPEDIVSDEPLFVEGLGLDSIDALELGMNVQKRYGVKLDANSADTKQHFASVKALEAFIEANRNK